jgi:micrococcal nuclease
MTSRPMQLAMLRRRIALVLMLSLSGAAFAGGKNQSPFTLDNPEKQKKKTSHKSSIVLNGVKTAVNWSDGDSFRILEGQYSGDGTRLVGYNTLEAYGPVHRWGSWTAKELYELERGDVAVAASQEWTCTADGKRDGFKRLLIDCPDVAMELVKQGRAMTYAVEGTRARPELLEAQRQAQARKLGIWAKGVPNGIITSVHSRGEDGPKGENSYNRVVDTRTGEALKRPHNDTYSVCQEVCVELDGTSSCMVYVPFERRFKNRADCLKGEP